ncbi:MAG: TMEM165/GDT1 family protein [Acidimicrobiales bacterium]
MSPGVAVTVFLLVAVAELPDKTMIATLVMGSRSRPLLVWLGAAGAFLVHVTAAVAAGRLLALLPHRTVEIVTTVLFFAGAVYLLVVPERSQEQRGAEEGARDLPERTWRVVGTAFVVILVGELGDLTQILTVNLEARYHQPASVFVGAYLALLTVAAIGAFGGRALLRVVPLAAVRRIGGVALLGFTAYGIYSLVR